MKAIQPATKRRLIGASVLIMLAIGLFMFNYAIREPYPQNEGSQKSTPLLVVHDNKEPNQPRLGIVESETGIWRSVNVPDLEKAGDLESLAAVPGQSNTFVTCESSGKCYPIKLEGSLENPTARVTGNPFQLPLTNHENQHVSIEAFAIQKIGDENVCAYGHRGSLRVNAEGIQDVAWTKLCKIDTNNFQITETGEFVLSSPIASTSLENRPVSDIWIAQDRHLVYSSTEDKGEAGPFQSTLSRVDPAAPQTTQLLGQIAHHKIEAISQLRDGRMIYGIDNESMGTGGGLLVQKDGQYIFIPLVLPQGQDPRQVGISGMAPADLTSETHAKAG